MAADFAVRVATAADVPALVALVNSAYRGDSSRAGWTTEADLIGGIRIDDERLIAAIEAEGNVILVHEADTEIVACAHLQDRSGGAYIGMLTTRPTLQRAGIGRRMLDAAEAWVREQWRATYMEMTVLVQRTDLIPWYERRGYSKTGEIKPFPYGDERWGLPVRDDLAFYVMRKELSSSG
jgi:ribosomal protein S18 acetylase RimI-like enzyme